MWRKRVKENQLLLDYGNGIDLSMHDNPKQGDHMNVDQIVFFLSLMHYILHFYRDNNFVMQFNYSVVAAFHIITRALAHDDDDNH